MPKSRLLECAELESGTRQAQDLFSPLLIWFPNAQLRTQSRPPCRCRDSLEPLEPSTGCLSRMSGWRWKWNEAWTDTLGGDADVPEGILATVLNAHYQPILKIIASSVVLWLDCSSGTPPSIFFSHSPGSWEGQIQEGSRGGFWGALCLSECLTGGYLPIVALTWPSLCWSLLEAPPSSHGDTCSIWLGACLYGLI